MLFEIVVFDIYVQDSGDKVSSYCRFLWIVAIVLIAGSRYNIVLESYDEVW